MASVSPLSPSEQAAKDQFVCDHPEYGYSGRIDGIYAAELSDRLGSSVYLDHAGCGLYTASQLDASRAYLSRALLLNPHSDPATGVVVDSVRERVLAHLGTSSRTHSVVWTYNASAALALLGSAFPFGPRSELALLMDNHNSAIGMREKVKARGGRFSMLRPVEHSSGESGTLHKELECCCGAALMQQYSASDAASSSSSTAAAAVSPALEPVQPCLFLYPGESNFDGRIYEASLAQRVKEYNFPLDASTNAVSPSASATNAESVSARDATAAAAAAGTCSANPLSLHRCGAPFRWYTALDASKLLATAPLDLGPGPEGHRADFVVVSFYKMFGYPTGLAALIVRNDAAQELWGVGGGVAAAAAASAAAAQRRGGPSTPAPASLSSLRSYFSGGTVNAVVADEDFHVLRGSGRLHELLEDGTLPFASIVALPCGLDLFRALGGPRAIHAHTTALIEDLFDWMRRLTYEENGRPLCVFYGARAAQARAQAQSQAPADATASGDAASSIRFGAVLNFNFVDVRGQVIGYKTVEKIASANRIYLRSGSFCNPGACQLSYPLSGAQIRHNVSAGYACWEEGENLGGVVNGSVRLSLGWSSRWEDVACFKQFVMAQIMPVGRQRFVSAMEPTPTGTNDAITTASTATGLSPVQVVRAEPLPSPFSFQLPAHFHVATPAAPALPRTDAAAAPDPAVHPRDPDRPLDTGVLASALDTPNDAQGPSSVGLVSAPTGAAAPSSQQALRAIPSPSLGPSPGPSLVPYPMPSSPLVLSSLTIYPVKSCGAVSLSSWWVMRAAAPPTSDGANGGGGSGGGGGATLFLDREFVLLDAYGSALSMKLLPHLALISPSIDVAQRRLTLTAPNTQPLVVSLAEDEQSDATGGGEGGGDPRTASLCSLQVCGQTSLGYVYDAPQHAHISEWLSAVVGKYTCLARKSRTLHWPTAGPRRDANGSAGSHKSLAPSPSAAPSSPPKVATAATATGASVHSSTVAPSTAPSQSRRSFANEDDFLLVSASSVREVERRLHAYVAGHKLLRSSPSAHDAHISPSRFRPNFVVDSAATALAPFAEDHWSAVHIGPFRLRVKGGCARCVMVNVDAQSAERNSALYALLNTCRKTEQGKVMFGSLLSDLAVDGDDEQRQSAAPQWWPIHVGMACSTEST